MEGITFRPIDPRCDFTALASLLNKVRTQPVTAERLLEWERIRPPDRLRRTLIARTDENALVGYNLVYHRVGAEVGRSYLDIAVDPAWSRQGIGGWLYDDAFKCALAQGATILDADPRDDCPECIRFAEERGLVINRHMVESVIDLHTFETSPYEALVQSLEAGGIHFFSLATVKNSEDTFRQLYEVNRICALDDPSSHGTFPSFEEFSSFFFIAPWFLAEGQILAADGDKIIGLSAVGYDANTNSMENMMTGVLAACRGSKIAQALKVLALKFAKSYGADSIITYNDSQNKPMLAVNNKLGYIRQVGEYHMVRRL